MRGKSIEGKYIGDAIGVCQCELHEGLLNKKLAKRHHCIAKKCKYLVKTSEDAWEKKDSYRNYGGRKVSGGRERFGW